jgi:hypothetical protein
MNGARIRYWLRAIRMMYSRARAYRAQEYLRALPYRMCKVELPLSNRTGRGLITANELTG